MKKELGALSLVGVLIIAVPSIAQNKVVIVPQNMLLLNAAYTDCNEVMNGTAYRDNCGICVGGNTGLIACLQDCNGDWGGTAYRDNCGICVGGNTGLIACLQDCNGDWGGTAYINTCGCVGGNTGVSTSVSCVTSAGQVWMDRNLGATRVATSMDDAEARGDLYQWGRLTDGHEKRTSQTTTTLSPTDVPGHDSFIITPSVTPWDWRSPKNDNLWQGVAGTNNPCPAGFRLPTDVELDTERLSWSSNDSAGAFASPLKLVPAGYRNAPDGVFGATGSYGYCWSSTVGGNYSRVLYFYSGNAAMGSYDRANGFSVRCLKD